MQEKTTLVFIAKMVTGLANHKMTQQFLNCQMAYECPKDWFELTPTNKAEVKYCNKCNQEVFLCLEEAELNERIARGVCVAYFIDPDHPKRFRLAREKALSKMKDPNFKPKIMMGLPSGSTPKAFFEKD
jgi:hypothetical protein